MGKCPGLCSLWDTFIIIWPFRLISTIYQLIEKNGGCSEAPEMFHAQKEEPYGKHQLDCFERKYHHQLMWIQMGIVWWWLWVNNHSAVVLIDKGAVVDTDNCEFFCSSGGGPHTPSLLGTVTSSWRSCDSSLEKRISLILSPSCYWQQDGAWNLIKGEY